MHPVCTAVDVATQIMERMVRMPPKPHKDMKLAKSRAISKRHKRGRWRRVGSRVVRTEHREVSLVLGFRGFEFRDALQIQGILGVHIGDWRERIRVGIFPGQHALLKLRVPPMPPT
jgi:hypothetical protein